VSSRTARRPRTPDGPVPVVGGREPCPCGSGRRYKACHGRAAGVAANPRPFAGRVDECDLVALREVVPSATASLTLADGSGRPVLLGTVLPVAWPAMVRADGTRMLGLQTSARSADPDRDLGQALEAVLDREAGQGLDDLAVPEPGAGLVSLLDPAPLEITVHPGFDWWLEGVQDPGEEATSALAEANGNVVPTARLSSVEAGYWCRITDRAHLRWALPDDEEPLLDAMARLAARQALTVGPGSRYVGAFRALGIVMPVWDLPLETEAAALEEPAAALRTALDEALADTTPLTGDERRARAGVVSRQLTLR
jgi:hypothetical protein